VLKRDSTGARGPAFTWFQWRELNHTLTGDRPLGPYRPPAPEAVCVDLFRSRREQQQEEPGGDIHVLFYR